MRSNPPHSSRRAGFNASPMLLLGLVVLGVIAFVLATNNKAVDGPKPVIWDKTPCIFCAMHLGDPRFAAQMTVEDGTTYFYDDPGCLFLHEKQLQIDGTPIHARWFRELNNDHWLAAEEAAFLRTDGSPMDYGLGAVPIGTPDSIGLPEATAEVLSK